MFSEWAIKAMNGTTSEDQLQCELCDRPMQSFWLLDGYKACQFCKASAEDEWFDCQIHTEVECFETRNSKTGEVTYRDCWP